MSLAGLLVRDITIVTPAATTSRYGDELKDWDNATRVTVKGWVSQTALAHSSEVLGDREAQVDTWTLFVLPDVTVTAADRVECAGRTFEVDGEPEHAWTPRGEHHLEVPLRFVEG